MAVLEIIKDPSPALRKIAKAVKKVTKEISSLIANMAETMYAAPGVGLAAPQVGEAWRIIVVDAGEGLVEFINPKVVRRAGKELGTEGCLSVPGVCGYVERAAKVKVKGLGKNGKVKELEAEGLLARALQHEIDHLDGILFIDKMVPIAEVEEKGPDASVQRPEEQECQPI